MNNIAKQTDFPWLMSNVKDRHTDQLLAEGHESHILVWNGRKVCLHVWTHSVIEVASGERGSGGVGLHFIGKHPHYKITRAASPSLC